jgi:hypothetical protein
MSMSNVQRMVSYQRTEGLLLFKVTTEIGDAVFPRAETEAVTRLRAPTMWDVSIGVGMRTVHTTSTSYRGRSPLALESCENEIH